MPGASAPTAEVPFVPSTGPACIWWATACATGHSSLPALFPLSSRLPFLGDKALDGYSKKKYVCKLLFIFLLGHDIDFGHMEAVNLLSSNRYTEKQIVSAGAPQRLKGAGLLWVSPRDHSVEEARARCLGCRWTWGDTGWGLS